MSFVNDNVTLNSVDFKLFSSVMGQKACYFFNPLKFHNKILYYIFYEGRHWFRGVLGIQMGSNLCPFLTG